jgi:hypothetical protein
VQKYLMPARRAKGGTKALSSTQRLEHGGRSRRSYTTGWPSSERQGTNCGALLRKSFANKEMRIAPVLRP